ncbi:hypothetical protein AAVH_02201 [Aphelenchoides avenae]|nr:hypothetical protein AAVH_02201 [Aphelenchus avenae]
MKGKALTLYGVSLKVNVNLADFMCSFSSIKSLSYSAGRWLDTIGLDDATLDSLASNGILNLSPRGSYSWDCRHLSEDALLAFAFGDSYANDRLRRFSGRECQLSETFILRLVRARRESQGNHRLFLDLEMDIKLVAADVELSIDDLRQHGQYDDDRGVWRFTFADIPNFRIEYDDILEGVQCWSNVSGDDFY